MSDNQRAIVFVTDEGFLFASLVAALEVAALLVPADGIDVLVYAIDIDADRLARLSILVRDAPVSVTLSTLESGDYGTAAGARRIVTHLPSATLARLVLGRRLPAHYRQVVYLDGDVRLVGDARPLLLHEVSPGRVLAANDSPWLFADDRAGAGRALRPWLARLGLDDPHDYFNAGVMVVARDVLDDAFPEALAWFESHPQDCPHMDQCALNAVLLGCRDRLSPLYNFQTDYALYGMERRHSPHLVHFTGGIKPWLLHAPPWHDRFEAGYAAFARRAERLVPGELARPALEPAQAARAAKLQRRRLDRIRYLSWWRPTLRRRRFDRYLRDTDFALS